MYGVQWLCTVQRAMVLYSAVYSGCIHKSNVLLFRGCKVLFWLKLLTVTCNSCIQYSTLAVHFTPDVNLVSLRWQLSDFAEFAKLAMELEFLDSVYSLFSEQ